MNPLDEEWESWKITYKKKYNSPEEETIRRAAWEKNKIYIEAHNKQYEQGLTSFTMGLNQFSDRISTSSKSANLCEMQYDIDEEVIKSYKNTPIAPSLPFELPLPRLQFAVSQPRSRLQKSFNQGSIMNPLDEEWESWKTTFEKKYNSPEEEAFRRAIWENKKIFIEAHNQQYEQGLSSFCLGLNDFADMVSTSSKSANN
ncbi:cystein proteinase inhibitor protein salarin-like [Misgurnus anguillicaudatus]|uniref:cystein proteinase inhibitor protein salarin-like n=1 Tax=Misgurnus anguillicaudatus TaxID=75329 RepID=UPI003CCFA9A2